MKIKNVKVMVLGFKENSGVTRGGESYDYRALSYVVVDEDASRRFYIDKDSPVLPVARGLSWGDFATISGDIDAKGGIKIESMKKDETDGKGDVFA